MNIGEIEMDQKENNKRGKTEQIILGLFIGALVLGLIFLLSKC